MFELDAPTSRRPPLSVPQMLSSHHPPVPLPHPISCTFFWIKIFIDLLSTYNYFTIIFFLLTFVLTLNENILLIIFKIATPVTSSVLLLVETIFFVSQPVHMVI